MPERSRADRLVAVCCEGDVLAAEPALRALCHEGDVTLVCATSDLPAAALIAGVAQIIGFDCPWHRDESGLGHGEAVDELLVAVRAAEPDRSVIFTGYRQSPLPLALVLRLAGVRHIAGRSEADPGSLLDIRLRRDPPFHEVERHLELVEALGIPAPFDRRIRVTVDDAPPVDVPPGAVLVHPGPTAGPLGLAGWSKAVDALWANGIPVVLTGGHRDEVASALRRRPSVAVDAVGIDDWRQVAALVAAARAACVGGLVPMHLAAATGTPVVVVPPTPERPERWQPWMIDHVLLGGRQHVEPADVLAAVASLVEQRPAEPSAAPVRRPAARGCRRAPAAT